MRRGLYVLAALLLAACGGGSGGDNNIGVAGVVPDVVDQTQAAATAAISAAGLRVGSVTMAGSGIIVAGNVISQNPAAGTSLPAGSNVDLVVSSGALPAFGLFEPFPKLSFDRPIFLAAVPTDRRLVVVEQTGRIRVFTPDPGVTTTSTILDVSALITTAGSEQGLLGFAFDPDFVNNNYIYVNYTRAADGATVVARYTWDPSTAAAGNATIILPPVAQPASNHNGGMLAFGPDGYLYIAMGDGGSDPTNGQNLNSLLGKILRIDASVVPYAIPGDNPFVGQPNHKEEIWAFGFRNPFRFSFDRNTGELWVGDVGQSQREEIDVVDKGLNYGWPVYEGSIVYPPYQNLPLGDAIPATPPLYEYDHSFGCAIIGGYVYRGSQLPSLFSHYLYTDFCSGTVWALDNSGQDNATLTTAPSPTSFGEDNDGELYVVSQNGRIYQLQ